MILIIEQLKRVRRRLLRSQSTFRNDTKHIYEQERGTKDNRIGGQGRKRSMFD
jgi:hypothetical protein